MAADFDIVEYSREHLERLIPMWRESFERAVGIVDPHPFAEQRDYFENVVLPANRVRVAVDPHGEIIGFLASTLDTIAQLYVHVDHQRRGIGSTLLAIAMHESGGRLRLFTFARNTTAQSFYRKHGFREVRRGFEEQWMLEDIEFEWNRATDPILDITDIRSRFRLEK